MNWDNEISAGAMTNQAQIGMARTPNLQERLNLAVANAEERLAAAKEAREIFAKHPDLEKLLNLMQRGLF